MSIELRKGAELQQRYVISDLIGQGGFVTVWRATDKQHARDVAIKRLLKRGGGDELEAILEEARKTARLKGHKNIVEMYEVFQEENEGFLVMEYVEGSTLDDVFRQHIKARTWVDVEEALDYFTQVLQGLLFAHSSGLFHRDVKPSNILVSKLGTIKLVDFGLAKPMHAPLAATPHPGFAWTGTPNFMSPEQASGDDLDHLTDVFSAGIIGYVLLTGRHPFNHPSGVAPVMDLIKELTFCCDAIEPGSIRGLSDSGSRVLAKMLSKDRTLRCQSILEPLNELTKEIALNCAQCGASNPVSNSFCGQCGKPLKIPGAAKYPAPELAEQRTKRTAAELTDEGFALTQTDDWQRAEERYREALQVDGSYARAYANLGYALIRLWKHADAIEIATKGIERTRDDAMLHRLYDTRGFARSALKEYDEAIDDFSKSLECNPRNPRVFSHRAESHALAGHYEEAYSDVVDALRLDPSHQPAIRLRAKLAERKNRAT